ncbi:MULTISPECIES: acid phosphatase [Nocardioides]|nr:MULTISPECIES: acid phosphatase [unclassified Nocardioides]
MTRSALMFVAVLALGGSLAVPAAATPHKAHPHKGTKIDHIVVIYEENHSFDNVFGGWERVRGLADAPPEPQIAPDGTVLPCLPQNDVNLTSPPLPVTCTGTVGSLAIRSAFENEPFRIDDYIQPQDTTCPVPGAPFQPNGVPDGSGLPGGCTRDLVHRFYNEQYQIHGGRQDRYVAGSDAVGLTMGTYDTTELPIYRYLHSAGAPHYAIADNFFQAAFGGSFLNHQWLIAARTPTWPGAVADYGANDLHSIVGPDGFPAGTLLHPATPGTKDAALTQAAASDGSCKVPAAGPTPPAGTVCGDYAVNTVQPPYQPYAPGTAVTRRLPAQTAPTIGDRLSGAGVDWAWYSGGWSNANGDVGAPGWTNGSTPGTCTDPNTIAGAVYPNCADKLFQFHHQPFNYYATYAPGTAARAAHLRDEEEFIAAAKSGDLKPVSFVKPVGAENEHPGYASEHSGSSHLVELLEAIENGPDADSTLVIVTYDEFGGQWDHVAPPHGVAGITDQWGPGTRIPALLVSPVLKHRFAVDRTEHDTTSILATIERRFRLRPLTTRDAAVADLFRAPVFPGNRP